MEEDKLNSNFLDCQSDSLFVVRKYKQPAFWDRLKRKILSLSEDNCIEIQSVDFKCSDDGFLLSLMVNGLFTVTDSSYYKVADELSCLMEVLIK